MTHSPQSLHLSYLHWLLPAALITDQGSSVGILKAVNILKIYLLINVMKHSWIVIFFRIIMETDHTIFLINTCKDFTIFYLK